MSFNSFMQTVAFLLKMWKIKCIFLKIAPSHGVEEINSGKQNVLTKNTVLRHT